MQLVFWHQSVPLVLIDPIFDIQYTVLSAFSSYYFLKSLYHAVKDGIVSHFHIVIRYTLGQI